LSPAEADVILRRRLDVTEVSKPADVDSAPAEPSQVTTPNGHNLSRRALREYGITEPAEIEALKGQIDALYADLCDVPGIANTQIMRYELVVGLARLLLKNYEPDGNDVTEFQQALNADAQSSLVWASYNDASEIAARLGRITGEEWAVQSEAEYDAAKAQLSGTNWTSTITDDEEHLGCKVFRHLHSVCRNLVPPEFRSNRYAVRLVRKPKTQQKLH
jgi:hypothetical protein